MIYKTTQIFESDTLIRNGMEELVKVAVIYSTGATYCIDIYKKFRHRTLQLLNLILHFSLHFVYFFLSTTLSFLTYLPSIIIFPSFSSPLCFSSQSSSFSLLFTPDYYSEYGFSSITHFIFLPLRSRFC